MAQGLALFGPEMSLPAQADVPLHGYALQCRVTTEDPENNFTPDYGRLTAYRSAAGFGVRLDAGTAENIIAEDKLIDTEFRAIVRQLITYMMEDPRTISTALDIVWIAKAIERVGDHAKNIAEQVIYIVHGTDVRHGGSGGAGGPAPTENP